ncbi:MAG: prepilin-type N-terminal cleavage/methylation domain-containing protein [Candidatus Omnitrophica bacterium]|nr:prepilin-type N-terminal cleavage/methylation domain-containing protein [Candidatus Omnitrophota bacterium]
MRSRYNKIRSKRGFSLIEVLITVGIISTGIVFLFSAFAAAMSAVKLSQNMTFACLLAENKIWETEQALRTGSSPQLNGAENIEGKDFKWDIEILDAAGSDPKKLKLNLSWKEKLKEKDYSLETLSYLKP